MIHDCMLYDLIQGQGHGGPTVEQIAESVSSAGNACSHTLSVNYDTSRQYLNFNWTGFWYSSQVVQGVT